MKMKTTKTIKFLSVLMLAALCSLQFSYAQPGKIYGKVLDEYGSVAIGAKVNLKRGQTIFSGAMVKADGEYEIAMVSPGSYELEVLFGDRSVIYKVDLAPGEYMPKDLKFNATEAEGGTRNYKSKGIIVYGNAELFKVDPEDPQIISREELSQMATTRNPTDLGGQIAGVYQADQGDPLSFRGGRPGSAAIYLDGMKIRGSNGVPQAAIGQVAFFTSGLPAEYGDVTGGVMVINTWNPGMRGSVGKMLTRDQRKALRQERKEKKKGSSESYFDMAKPCFTYNSMPQGF